MALASGLVEYWKLSETSGTRNGSLSAFNLTDSGATGSSHFIPENNTTTQGSGCAVFTGTTFLSVADNASLRVSPTVGLSLSCWVNFSSFPAGDSATVCGKASTDGCEYTIQLNNFANPDSRRATFGMGAAFAFATTSPTDGIFFDLVPYQAGLWYHMVGVFSPATATAGPAMNFYVQNRLFGTNTTITAASITSGIGTSRFGVGARVTSASAGGKNMSGNVCNVGLWNRALNLGEIGDLFNGGLSMAYPFTNNAGRTV